MTPPETAFDLPLWAKDLISSGERFYDLIHNHEDRRLTVALCLPRVEFSAGFIGLGILKNALEQVLQSNEPQLRELLGSMVSYQDPKGRVVVGILELRENEKTYSILEPINVSKSLKPGAVTQRRTLLKPREYGKVTALPMNFNPNRQIRSRQIEKVISHNQSILELSRILDCELTHLQSRPLGVLFNVFGNLSRIRSEWSQSLSKDKNVILGEVLRPADEKDCEDSHRCRFFPVHSEIAENDSCIEIIEGSRALPDQLSSTRSLNRIILLARNAPCYKDCVASLRESYSLCKGDATGFNIENSKPIISLAFFHK
ncbi:MAG: hypothetical protein PHF70_03070 [Opitutales bacterium]|nr:hypothetical protein [Opitutales bacterium]